MSAIDNINNEEVEEGQIASSPSSNVDGRRNHHHFKSSKFNKSSSSKRSRSRQRSESRYSRDRSSRSSDNRHKKRRKDRKSSSKSTSRSGSRSTRSRSRHKTPERYRHSNYKSYSSFHRGGSDFRRKRFGGHYFRGSFRGGNPNPKAVEFRKSGLSYASISRSPLKSKEQRKSDSPKSAKTSSSSRSKTPTSRSSKSFNKSPFESPKCLTEKSLPVNNKVNDKTNDKLSDKINDKVNYNRSTILDPSEIKRKENEKQQSFLQMLEHKNSKAKLDYANQQQQTNTISSVVVTPVSHSFVSTFAAISSNDKLTLNLETDEDWKLIPKSESSSKKSSRKSSKKSIDRKMMNDINEFNVILDKQIQEQMNKIKESDKKDNSKKKKKKESIQRKKSKKRKRSVSESDSYTSSSDEDEDEKRSSKRKKKHKKIKSSKKNLNESSEFVESENSKNVKIKKERHNESDEKIESNNKKRKHSRKKRKHHHSKKKSHHSSSSCSSSSSSSSDDSSSDSDSSSESEDEIVTKEERKKSKKRKPSKKKHSRKRKVSTSESSSSSESSDSSDEEEVRSRKKTKKRKLSKKEKKQIKKRVKKEKKKRKNDSKNSDKVNENDKSMDKLDKPIEKALENSKIKSTEKNEKQKEIKQDKIDKKKEIEQDKETRKEEKEIIKQDSNQASPNQMKIDPVRASSTKYHYTKAEPSISYSINPLVYDLIKNSSKMNGLSEEEFERMREHSKSKEIELKTHSDKKQASESSYKTSSSSKYEDKEEEIELKVDNLRDSLVANNSDSLNNNTCNNNENNSTQPSPDLQATATTNAVNMKEKLAKELLDKIRRKKENKKLSDQIREQKDELNLDEDIKNSLNDDKSFDVTKIDEAKLNGIKETLARIQKQRTPGLYGYDLNQDYLWYLQYYMNSYGLDTFSAAYYAQYAIVTSSDYKSKDIGQWMQNQGYNYLQQDEQPVQKISLISDLKKEPENKLDLINNIEKETKVEDKKTEIKEENECFNDCNASTIKPTIKEEQTNQSDDLTEMDQTDSPPISPPELPRMSTFTALNSITLPDGTQLPAGTQQVFVYPYRPSSNLTILTKET